MESYGEAPRENSELRERLSRLSEASLRINESLDLDAVLQGVLDGARSLTDARYALITTLDAFGQVEEFLVSGLTPEEAQRLWEMPERLKFFEYLSNLPGPLRVRDFADHARSMGLPDSRPPAPVSSFLAAPIRHRSVEVGNIYVAHDEPDSEFSDEDEETLVMFASQGALAIANARRHRDEQRARADLEALIETSPVGVAVYDVARGALTSFNREAARILEVLRMPDRPVEQLLEVLTIQRADGRELLLGELAMAQAPSMGETVRAEEVVFRVPDGRSVTVLMNATPIRWEDGEVESFVVTLQDMTPLEELERLRAEFRGMVSHELRAPLASIKGSAASLIEFWPSLDPAEMLLFFRIIEQQADHMSALITDLLTLAHIETGTLSVSPEPSEPAVLVNEARNTFRTGGQKSSISVDLELELPRVMADRRRIVQVLVNLLSNAARHSPESAAIRVAASRDGVHVAFAVTDNGDELPANVAHGLFGNCSPADGLDRTPGVGRSGLGLTICKGIVEAHGGRIWAERDGLGSGSRVTFTLPIAEDPGHVATDPQGGSVAHPRSSGRGLTRILVVDDDPQTLRDARHSLREAGYAVTVTRDPGQVGRLMASEKPHAVLLDLILPEVDGIQLMQDTPGLADVPVIFLSVYGRDQIIAQALDAGADDYVVKPFSPITLVARVQAALRRRAVPKPAEPSEPYRVGHLVIDYTERSVSMAGRPIKLTDLEYRLLFELSVNSGQVLNHQQLLQRVWGPGHPGYSGPVRTVVKNLRRKLDDDAGNPTYIFNEPRVGYRMVRGDGFSPPLE